jgi:hypothetical protein
MDGYKRPISDPVFEDRTLYGIDGRNANDIYVCGSSGRIFHYNGSTWEEMYDYDKLNETLYGIWAGPTTVITVGNDGEVASYDGSTWTHAQDGPYQEFNSIWVGSSTDAVAVGDDGMIYRYDGDTWTDEAVGGLEYHVYYGISGTTGNLFISGSGGILLHDSGSGWEFVSDSDVTTEYLYDVWSSGSQAIAVGDDGEAVYYDGSLFSLMTTGTSEDLAAVWGSSPSDVFAVGYNGKIIHYDGNVSKVWEAMDTGLDVELEDVWGTAHNNVYACGGYGLLLHYDGSTWERVQLDAYEWFNAIGGTGEDDIYLVGYDEVFHFDGISWTHLTQMATNHTLHDITCGPDGSTFACGNEGGIIYKAP